MIAVLVSVAVAVAAYIGYDLRSLRHDKPDPVDPPFSISELVDLSGELRNLGPFDQEAWR